MARRAKAKTRDPQEILLDTLTEAIKTGVLNGLVVEAAAPTTTQVKRRKDGSFRTVPVSQGEEMTPSGVKVHAKNGRVIFEFAPIDPNGEISQYDFDETKVFTAFPELESLVVRALGWEAVDTDDNPVRFAQVRDKYLKNVAEIETKRAEKEAAKEAEKEKDHYGSHPLYGMFG